MLNYIGGFPKETDVALPMAIPVSDLPRVFFGVSNICVNQLFGMTYDVAGDRKMYSGALCTLLGFVQRINADSVNKTIGTGMDGNVEIKCHHCKTITYGSTSPYMLTNL